MRQSLYDHRRPSSPLAYPPARHDPFRQAPRLPTRRAAPFPAIRRARGGGSAGGGVDRGGDTRTVKEFLIADATKKAGIAPGLRRVRRDWLYSAFCHPLHNLRIAPKDPFFFTKCATNVPCIVKFTAWYIFPSLLTRSPWDRPLFCHSISMHADSSLFCASLYFLRASPSRALRSSIIAFVTISPPPGHPRRAK